MRTLLKVLLLLLLATSSLGAATPRQARTYRKRVINKRAIAGSVAGAGVGQLRNSPHEWGRGAGGFAKRVGSSFGTHVVNATIQMGVATVHHENLRYQRSNRHGFWPRTKYAVKSTFIVPRTNRPGKTVALSRVSGNLGAGVISRAWQPASAAGIGSGLATGGIGLGAEVGANMAREFWPKKRKTMVRTPTHQLSYVRGHTTEWASSSH